MIAIWIFLQILKKLVKEVNALKVAHTGKQSTSVHEDNSDEDLEQNAPEEKKVWKIKSIYLYLLLKLS